LRQRHSTRLSLDLLEARDLPSTYYVAATNSSDSNPGSAAAPWATLQYAANHVVAGDTVIVGAGSYAGFQLGTSGAPGAPITFHANPGVLINVPNPVRGQHGINLEGASYVVIEGFTVTGMPQAGIRAVTDDHVTIRGNVCDQNGTWGILTGFSDFLLIENNVAARSAAQHGIYVGNSGDFPIIRNNVCWGNHDCGIHMNGDVNMGGDGIISGALVEGNIIYGNGSGGGSAINCDGVQGSIIRNNLLYDNHASGISLYQIDGGGPASNNIIANNTIVLASNARWALNIQDGSTGDVLVNNILYNLNPSHGSIDISADSLPGLHSDYNVVMNSFTDAGTIVSLAQWRANTGQDQHSIIAVPSDLFVSSTDYHLKSGSPAIDTGTSLDAPLVDLAGGARPSGAAFDIGAYEFQSSSPPGPTPPPPGPTPPPPGPTPPPPGPTPPPAPGSDTTPPAIVGSQFMRAGGFGVISLQFSEALNPAGVQSVSSYLALVTHPGRGGSRLVRPLMAVYNATTHTAMIVVGLQSKDTQVVLAMLQPGAVTDLAGNPLATGIVGVFKVPARRR
jgi:Right handed beta helix region